MPIFSWFMQSFSRSIRDINGEKNISLLMIFFMVSFSRFAPSRFCEILKQKKNGLPMSKDTVCATPRLKKASLQDRREVIRGRISDEKLP